MLKKTIIIISLLALSGCIKTASTSKIYTADGNKGYSVNCSGADKDWGYCYQKAGDLCKERGYDVLEVTGEAGTVTSMKSSAGVSTAKTSTVHNRIMVIECRRIISTETYPLPLDSL
ncbi:MAG: hypothetical protein R3D71_06715 [Rickettsiales bacterium]